ncbi:electron transport protein [Bacillus alkalicellulosilyticus]|uniref:electron transport protein n=1 Tax=Alkalihalobacterium alkalicellulosilyticum TaxID=1912214 RepID=UPI0009968122|nr:electron transport protein [Bacillus alkalicellulosilyticus]
MKTRYLLLIGIIVIFIVGIVIVNAVEPEYAYIPLVDNVLNESVNFQGTSYDLWGVTISAQDANRSFVPLGDTEILSPKSGAVKVTEEFVDLGRELFYKETFGNQVFFTDIFGLIDGPLTIANIGKAIIGLKGGYTDNLQVELAYDVTIGDKTYKKGEKIDTGLDVAKGALTPIGMPLSYADGRLRAGVSCAACHATVDMNTGKVVEGAPNKNLNGGLMLALATNSSAYFMLTDVDTEQLQKYIVKSHPEVAEKLVSLPDSKRLEEVVDEMLVKWPKGNFDTTMDLVLNPTQIPDSFTLGDHPYGWNGFASVGPFNGLSTFNNNVHAQNTDVLAQQEQSEDLFGLDKEIYIGTILQNAAHEKYRYDPNSSMLPTEYLASISEVPKVPGVNDTIKAPTFPDVSIFTPSGNMVSAPGYRVGEQINAMSAYQNTLVPPKYTERITEEGKNRGRKVFQQAGCVSCHAGAAFTNHQVIPQERIKTEPSRAQSFEKVTELMGKSYSYTPDTPVPIPEDATIIEVPTEHLSDEQKKLIFAQDEKGKGGYKVKGLIGLAWTAPYLHDGGVAVGLDPKKNLGLPGTLGKNIKPDPYQSLRALVDKELRRKVVEANRSSKDLRDAHVEGSGHEFWVDEDSGFTKEEQDALIQYLLSLTESDPKLGVDEQKN